MIKLTLYNYNYNKKWYCTNIDNTTTNGVPSSTEEIIAVPGEMISFPKNKEQHVFYHLIKGNLFTRENHLPQLISAYSSFIQKLKTNCVHNIDIFIVYSGVKKKYLDANYETLINNAHSINLEHSEYLKKNLSHLYEFARLNFLTTQISHLYNLMKNEHYDFANNTQSDDKLVQLYIHDELYKVKLNNIKDKVITNKVHYTSLKNIKDINQNAFILGDTMDNFIKVWSQIRAKNTKVDKKIKKKSTNTDNFTSS
jgi:hypothetical protein